MLDHIGSANMTQGSLTSFIEDRFGNAMSALALNDGWTQVPSGVYFDTPEFTVSVWVYPQNVGTFARVIDFGNGQNADNILLRLNSGTTNVAVPALRINNRSISIGTAQSTRVLKNLTWQHLTATFNGSQMYLYINSVLRGKYSSVFNLPNITRMYNYIGKANGATGYSSSYLDDLRFYNKSLTQPEIFELMKKDFSSK